MQSLLKRVSYRLETLMLQRPWPQFLPRGKGGASEEGGKRREAFFTFTFSFYSHSSNLPPHPFSWPTFPPSAAPLQAAPSSSSSSGMCAGVLLTQHSPHRGRTTTREFVCVLRCVAASAAGFQRYVNRTSGRKQGMSSSSKGFRLNLPGIA